MTRLNSRIFAASLAVVLASGTAVAMAKGPGNCEPNMDGPRAEKMQQRMSEQRAQHQAKLKAQLKLNAEQEAAWAQYVQAMQPMAQGAMANHPKPEDMAKLTTPQRIDAMQAMKTQRDAHMTQMADATKAFYNTLSAEQKAIFDAETLHRPGQHSMGKHGPQRFMHSPKG